MRRQAGQALRELHCLGLQHGVVHAVPDQTPLRGLLGADALVEQRHAQRPRGANQARDEPGAPQVRHEAQARQEGQVEVGAARGQHHVAGERDAHARAGRRTVDGTDDGYRQGAHRANEGVAEFLHPVGGFIAACLAGLRRARSVHGTQVGAGAEGLSGASQHHRANLAVPGDARQSVAQCQLQGLGDRIELVGQVERQGGDAAVAIEVEEHVGHQSLSRTTRWAGPLPSHGDGCRPAGALAGRGRGARVRSATPPARSTVSMCESAIRTPCWRRARRVDGSARWGDGQAGAIPCATLRHGPARPQSPLWAAVRKGKR